MALGLTFTLSHCNQNQSQDEGAGGYDDETEIEQQDSVVVYILWETRVVLVKDGHCCVYHY